MRHGCVYHTENLLTGAIGNCSMISETKVKVFEGNPDGSEDIVLSVDDFLEQYRLLGEHLNENKISKWCLTSLEENHLDTPRIFSDYETAYQAMKADYKRCLKCVRYDLDFYNKLSPFSAHISGDMAIWEWRLDKIFYEVT